MFDPTYILPGLLFAALFIWYTRRKNALSLDGALTAAGVGLWVLFLADPLWLLPLFFFFISSLLLGKLNRSRLSAADSKHGQPRDFKQVLCNGGVYAALATLATGSESQTAQTLMLLSMAASTADTWSSEIGQYFRQKTFDILRRQTVPVGLSGGVSLAGTLGGLGGALAMATLGTLLIDRSFQPAGMVLISLGGFAGMLLDSVLGAALQARYRHPETGALSDRKDTGFVLHSGFSWMSNDAVNWWSNVLVVAAGYLLL